MKITTQTGQTAVPILTAALALGWLFDQLFYGQMLGVSVLLFVTLVLAVLYGAGYRAGVRPIAGNSWLVIPLVFLAAMVFIRANLFLTFLNLSGTLLLLAYTAYYYAAGNAAEMGLATIPTVPLQMSWQGVTGARPLAAEQIQMRSTPGKGRGNLAPVLRGFLLALPVLLLFTLLLTSADLIFAAYVDALRQNFLLRLIEWISRAILIVMVGWLLAGSLVYAYRRESGDETAGFLEQIGKLLPQHVSLGFVEATTILSLVNALFAFFVFIQSMYLFGGRANIHTDGFTYADYARRGFFELVAVSVLTLALIVFLNWLTRRENKRQLSLFNALSSLMVGLVLVILVAAFQRMALYEAAYGFTQLRLYVYVFMIWLGVTLAWFLVSLWWRPHQFAIGLFLAALGFLITLNLVNPDAFIARRNLARQNPAAHAETGRGRLDANYLTHLSVDATPVLVAALDDLPEEERELLEEALRERLAVMEADERWRRWPAFHLGRQRAYRALMRLGAW